MADKLEQLKEEVDKLKSLLEDPNIAGFGCQMFLDERINKIAELYFGEKKVEEFECLINCQKDGIAHVEVHGEDDKSYMEFPIKDLEEQQILVVAGVIFQMRITTMGKWEKMDLTQIKRKPMTTEELYRKIKKYDKYNNV